MRWLVPLILLLLHGPVLAAARFEARVLRVKDGDSVVVEQLLARRRSEIRLAGIDAPEYSQPWGLQARAALSRMLGRGDVTVEVVDRDRYNRLVARVWVGRRYVNAEMVRSGNAWAFDRYVPDREIRAAEAAARTARAGLWALPPEDRLPPATWRALHPRRD
jgi:endonuclease YncB( thermonuclease family)